MKENNNEKLTNNLTTDNQIKRSEWRRKGWSIPDIRGSKNNWFILVKNLVTLVNENNANDLDSIPVIPDIEQKYTWRTYLPFLKGIGLVNNILGTLHLSDKGIKFLNTPTKRQLANLIHDRIKLFGEVLNLIALQPMTIEEANKKICKEYKLNWNNVRHIRDRMDWLGVLDLIQEIGNRKWEVTPEGKVALKDWVLISQDVIEPLEIEPKEIEIPEPSEEIAVLLQRLIDFPELHKKRSTYNIWLPSPNRIENLRIIIQSTLEKITRSDFFNFISTEFNLKISCIESMIPFLRVSGFIEEVGRNIYMATPAAKAWIETGNDLDFIRILHSHMQFVGEMIKIAENDIIRNDIYEQAKLYGLNINKARWIAGFLLEAGLLEETKYLHLKATPLGIHFANSLPLSDIDNMISEEKKTNNKIVTSPTDILETIANRLIKTSKDPSAEGKTLGIAFEESIAEIFTFMGFEAKKIGGPGDTDVIVHWKDKEGKIVTAIIDGKSKSGGQVSHNDISEVAIETHKDKNNSNYVAIVGSQFSGDTIKNHARKKGFALITTEQLIDIARASIKFGLSLQEISLIFKEPNGFSQLNELITQKQRELDIISIVISKINKEQEQIGALSPRDLFLLLRDTEVSPSLEELISVFETLSSIEVGLLEKIDKNSLPEYTMYVLRESKKSIFRLQALATTIEKSINK